MFHYSRNLVFFRVPVINRDLTCRKIIFRNYFQYFLFLLYIVNRMSNQNTESFKSSTERFSVPLDITSPCIKRNSSSVDSCESSCEQCSICLSPMKSIFDCCDLERIAVTTKCNHQFHEHCLNEAKLSKSECPMCRSQLTPPSNNYIADGNYYRTSTQSTLNSNNLRMAVIDAASRARNAVRMAMAERQQQVLC